MFEDLCLKAFIIMLFTIGPVLNCIEEFLCVTSCRPPEERILREKNLTVQILNFDVPTPVIYGDSVLLHCEYYLATNETLYAVKWYKNQGEFFRYVPRSNPMFKVILQPGTRVDVRKSDHNEVYLKDLRMDSYGNYTCQISTDAPTFLCVQRTKLLRVIIPPSDGPVLHVEDEDKDFVLGDDVTITCTSGFGKPAAKLAWYVNDVPVEANSSNVTIYKNLIEKSNLLMQFKLESEIFKEGKAVIKCVSSIHTIESMATTNIIAVPRYRDTVYKVCFNETATTCCANAMKSMMSLAWCVVLIKLINISS